MCCTLHHLASNCWWNALIKCFDRVLVEKVAVEKTKAGILLPEKAQGAVNEAVVIAVGPGIKNKLSMIRAVMRGVVQETRGAYRAKIAPR